MFRVISIYLIKTWKTATLKCSEETVNNSLSGNSVNPVQTVPLFYVPPSHKASKQVHLSSSSRKLDFPHPSRLVLQLRARNLHLWSSPWLSWLAAQKTKPSHPDAEEGQRKFGIWSSSKHWTEQKAEVEAVISTRSATKLYHAGKQIVTV